MDLAGQHGLTRVDAGPMQVITNLLRDTANLLEHDRLDLFDGGLLAGPQRAQGGLQYRQRGFQAVGEVG
ncbi:hypothetical protein D3C80_1949380 [compost metagenome]